MAKIADFGLCATITPGKSHISNIRNGTPFYAAPEVVSTGILTRNSDVYAFGVLVSTGHQRTSLLYLSAACCRHSVRGSSSCENSHPSIQGPLLTSILTMSFVWPYSRRCGSCLQARFPGRRPPVVVAAASSCWHVTSRSKQLGEANCLVYASYAAVLPQLGCTRHACQYHLPVVHCFRPL